MRKYQTLRYTLVVIALCLGAVTASVWEANNSEDVDFFVVHNPDKYAALMFYDPTQELADPDLTAQVDKTIGIFLNVGEEGRSEEEWVNTLNDKAHLMRINSMSENNEDIVSKYKITTVPFIILFKDEEVILEEIVNENTYEHVKDVLYKAEEKDATTTPETTTATTPELVKEDNPETTKETTPAVDSPQNVTPVVVTPKPATPEEDKGESQASAQPSTETAAPPTEEVNPSQPSTPETTPTEDASTSANLEDVEKQLQEAQQTSADAEKKMEEARKALNEAKDKMNTMTGVEKAKLEAAKAQRKAKEAMDKYLEAKKAVQGNLKPQSAPTPAASRSPGVSRGTGAPVSSSENRPASSVSSSSSPSRIPHIHSSGVHEGSTYPRIDSYHPSSYGLESSSRPQIKSNSGSASTRKGGVTKISEGGVPVSHTTPSSFNGSSRPSGVTKISGSGSNPSSSTASGSSRSSTTSPHISPYQGTYGRKPQRSGVSH